MSQKHTRVKQMITLTKDGLTIDGQASEFNVPNRVKVYFNLHKKMFSVVSLDKETYGLVVTHVDEVHLVNCQFVVSEAGRQRVIREQRKNVHAYVKGQLGVSVSGEETEASYNPYKKGSFYIKGTEEDLYTATFARLSGKKVFIAN